MNSRSSVQFDVEEQMTHVRTVHFGLLALCFLLIATALLSRENEVARALAQLSGLNNVLRKWDERWLAQYAHQEVLSGRLANSVALPQAWTLSQTRVTGPIVLKRPDVDYTLWPLPAELGTLVRNPGGHVERSNPPQFPRPQTLAQFKRLWNALDTTLTLRRFRRLADSAYLYSDQDASTVIHEIGYFRVPVTPGEVRSPACEMPSRPHFDPDASRTPFGDYPYLVVGFCYIESSGYSWYAWSPVVALDSTVFNGLEAFSKQHEISKQYKIAPALGHFERSFPELSKVTADYDDLTFDRLFDVLSAEVARSGERVELFGTKLPGGYIAVWGLPVLCMMQLYMVLHLQALRVSVRRRSNSNFIAWIGIYPSITAQVTMAVSLFLLPVLTAGVLRHSQGGWFSPAPEMIFSDALVIASIGLSLIAVLNWRNILRNVTE